MNREMKDSRVEWLGEIPKDWKVTKIKHKFKIVAGATPKSEQKENFAILLACLMPHLTAL